jgi:REP element-mobilizing transposase RayT
MARPLRLDLKNGWYHVANRGNNRQAIYLDNRDRKHFVDLLGEMSGRYAVEIHGYALMNNHYHLLVRTPEANLSSAIQWLNVAYSIWWNRRHGRSGHVFGGRFKAVLVEAGEWVLTCSLYVHLNPVAIQSLGLSKGQKRAEGRGLSKPERELLAKRLERLRSYRWSSYPAYAGYAAPPDWLCSQELLERAGSKEAYRRMAEDRLKEGEAEGLLSQMKWGLILGGARFAEEMRGRIKTCRESTMRRGLRRRRSWAEVVAAVEQKRGERWKAFAQRHGDSGLAMALYVARLCTGQTLRELGEAVGGMDYAAVAAAVRRYEVKLGKDGTLKSQTEEVLKAIEKI